MAWFRNIFRNTSMPTRINQAQINQSVQGYPLPVLMGANKVQQSLLWLDGFDSSTISGSTGGTKGIGNGKGSEYDYTADVIAALVDGSTGVNSIRDVWSNSTWLTNGQTTETYTIDSSLIYSASNASRFVADHGVSMSVNIDATATDLGGTTRSLTGTMSAPLQQVAPGSTLTTGQYTVNDGEYSFAAADEGKTVIVSYSFTLKTNTQQTIAIIPSSLEVTLGTNVNSGEGSFYADLGVTYYSTGDAGTQNQNGTALVSVSGTPTAAGTYHVSGNLPAVYHFAAGDVGKEVLITYEIDVSKNLLTGTSSSLSFQLIEGAMLQQPWSLLESKFPYATLGYSGKALIVYGPMDLGVSGSVQQNTFEVLTADAWGGGVIDANPIQCILQVLTNTVWGLGSGPVPFPTSAIDNGSLGTWGTGATSGLVNVGTFSAASIGVPRTGGTTSTSDTAADWFAANGFFISPLLDRQDTAASVISKWLEAGQCPGFMSEGLLKLVPYGDTTTAGNGSVWTAISEYAAVLTDDDFVVTEEGQEPVKISCTAWMDAYNKVQVSWTNRANQYSPEVTQEWDQAAINRYGERLEDAQSYDFVCTLDAAIFAASMRVKRSVYTRNTYEFSLGFQYVYLEPMDVVSITSSSSWAPSVSNQNLGLTTRPVRILKIVDKADGTLDITAEDYPTQLLAPSIFNKGTALAVSFIDQYADPGTTTAVIFEAFNRLTSYAGNEIWIGACGDNDNWGSCNVLASTDGEDYASIGTISSSARIGSLVAALPAGSDPDTTDTLVVDLVNGTLTAGTQADADAGNTLCYLDGEIIAYSALSVTAADQYTMSGYLRRGLMGSTPIAHAVGEPFLRLDSAVWKYTYDPSWAGKTIYLKFQSVNTFGVARDASTITAVQFTVPGVNQGAYSKTTGVAVAALSAVTATTATTATTAGSATTAGTVNTSTVIQSLVDAGAIAPGTYDGQTYTKQEEQN